MTAARALKFRQVRCRLGIPPGRWLLWVEVRRQRMSLYERGTAHDDVGDISQGADGRDGPGGIGVLRRTFRISSSRFGTGERSGSNCTPLGLHRIAAKFGGGWPSGAVFKSRRFAGYTWAGLPDAAITHRILWLEGLEPGRNRGGVVDTFARYIYIHGTGNEPTLGRPASRGCIHLAAVDLIPLYDRLPTGTLVWIEG